MRISHSSTISLSNPLDFRVDHLYTFFLRWNPDRSSDPLLDDPYADENTLSTPTNRPLSNSSSKHNESPSAKGFVLLANDDPELADDYIRSKNKNNNSSKPRASSDSDESKKQHYLKRQNTLLKEWEVRIPFPTLRTSSGRKQSSANEIYQNENVIL